MTATLFTVRRERPEDAGIIERLNAEAFGPGRYARSAYRIRERAAHDPALSFVAEANGRVVSSVRLTAIQIGGHQALLLGPLVVDPNWKGRGAGKLLVRTALDAARAAGHRLVLLVGDEAYYGPLGFRRLRPYQVTMPGPADPSRVLVAELVPGAADGVSGRAEAG